MAEMAQYLAVAGGISERHILKSDARLITPITLITPSIPIILITPTLLSLVAIQLFQSVYARCAVNHRRHHIQQLQDRVLNHTHELQKRGHHTKGDGAVSQADAAPDECQQIAQSEGAAHDEPCDQRKPCAPHHIAPQTLLHRVEATRHPLLAAQRPQHGIMLHALLHLHLYATLVLADAEGHLPQPSGDELAEDDGKGGEQQQGPRQPSVEPTHQQKGTAELNHRHGHLRQRVGTGVGHLVDVLRQSRGDVAGVQLLFGEQLTVEEAAEYPEPQAVSLLDAGDGRQPEYHLVHRDAAHDGQHQQHHHPPHVVGGARSDGLVDKQLAEPYHQQSEHHLTDAGHDASRQMPADPPHIPPQPNYVLHFSDYSDYSDYSDLIPLSDDLFDIAAGLVGRHLIFLAEPLSQRLYGKFAQRLRLFPQPGRRLVQGQQPSEVNGIEPFAHYHMFAAHLPQHKSLLNFHL